MSSKPPNRYQLLQWINLCVGAHDMICTCSTPTLHLLKELTNKKEEYYVTAEEKHNIEKCLIITDAVAATTEDDGIGPGDLDLLFTEDDAGENAKG